MLDARSVDSDFRRVRSSGDPESERRTRHVLSAVLDREDVSPGLLRLHVQCKRAVSVVVKLAVSNL